MTKTSRTSFALIACLASLAFAPTVHADSFDFTPGTATNPDGSPNLASGGGTAYSWYYQHINLDFSGMPDGSDDNNPYITFDGTDASSAGHCIQISFDALPPCPYGGPDTPDCSKFPAVQDLEVSTTDINGNDFEVSNGAIDGTGYASATRIWIQKTGTGSLYWHLKIQDDDGQFGSWDQSAEMNLWRFELNQADCTTNSGKPWLSIVGNSSNYTLHGSYAGR
jgi:hypothetical protein